MVTEKQVTEMIDELEKQETFAPYESQLLKALYKWLKNYNRRKY